MNAATFAAGTAPRPLPELIFAVVGAARAGTAALQSALDGHPQARCMGDVLSDCDQVRRLVHESFYGPAPPGAASAHCSNDPISPGNPERYLEAHVFRAPFELKAFGVKLTYEQLAHYDLWDYLADKLRQGSFCLVHLVRNPLMCSLSWARARLRRSWYLPAGSSARPSSVSLPGLTDEGQQALLQSVRDHEARQLRLERLGADRFDLSYRRLCRQPSDAWRAVCDYLELPPCAGLQPRTRKLDEPSRLALTAMTAGAPAEVRRYLQDPEMY